MNVRRNEKIDFVGRGKSVGMLIHEGEWWFENTQAFACTAQTHAGIVSLGRAEVMLEEGVKEKVVCSGLYETSNRCWKVKSNYRKRDESHF